MGAVIRFNLLPGLELRLTGAELAVLGGMLAFIGILVFLFVVFLLAMYVLYAVGLMKLASHRNRKNA